MLRNPYILRDDQRRGRKSEMATSPLPSRGPKSGRNCYVTRTFSGSPTKGKKIRRGRLTLAFLEGQKRAEMIRNAYVLGDPQKK